MCAGSSNGDRFAYCTALAVYVYEVRKGLLAVTIGMTSGTILDNSPISICFNAGDWCRIYPPKRPKTNRAKIKSSHVLLIFQCNIIVFCAFLLGIALVKYCAVAVCRNGTHNRPNLAYFAFPEDNTRRRKWIAFCKRADKKFKSLVDPRICSLHFKTTDVTVSVSGRKTVTGCPTIFDPTSAKTTTSAPEKLHEKRQTRRPDQGPATKKRCVKKLNFRNDAENCEKDRPCRRK